MKDETEEHALTEEGREFHRVAAEDAKEEKLAEVLAKGTKRLVG